MLEGRGFEGPQPQTDGDEDGDESWGPVRGSPEYLRKLDFLRVFENV